MADIELTTEVHQRLEARRREGESISDVIDRLLLETSPHWREGFSMASREDRERLRKSVETQRRALSQSLSKRQEAALEQMEKTNR